ncbi:MAG: hypothetical protein FWC65_00085 [Treponema sp.]|nr:hypothetical protein [Treponema sp.]
MKKILVGLLVLAVAGGSAFAQTARWHGTIDSFLGMQDRGAADDAEFGMMSPNNGANGIRLDLFGDFANAEGNAGARLMLRGNALAGGQEQTALWFRQAFGWVRPFGDIVEFRAGRMAEEPHLNNRDGLLNANFSAAGFVGAATGVIAYVFPMEGLVIGGGLWSNGAANNAVAFEDGGLVVYGGFAYTMPDLLRFNTNFWFSEPQVGVSGVNERARVVASVANVGLQIFAIDGVAINTGFSFYDLNEFSDDGIIHGIVTVGLNELADNLSVGLGGMFAMHQNDNVDDPAFGAGLWLSYAIDNIIPRLDIWYFSGTTFNWNCNNTWAQVERARFTFNSDQSFLHLRPTVRFMATNAAWFELGGVFNVELGDIGAAGGTSDDSFSFGFFAGVRVAF